MRGAACLVVAAAVLLAGCGGNDGGAGENTSDPAAPKVEDPGPIHVHGLGVNPKDGALFIATHTGLFRAPRGERTARRVADRYQDTMGFTVVGPDRFLGSGHPDGRESLPPFLGLIESRDAGESWREVSLMGKSDFHVLEASGDRVYGFGSNYGTRTAEFLVSNDGGRSWNEREPAGSMISLAISPRDPDRIVAAAGESLYFSDDGGRSWETFASDVGLLAWTPSGSLYLADAAGAVSVRGRGNPPWRQVGAIGGQPAAFDSAGDDLYAALHDGTVKRSADGGRSWTVRSEP